MIREKAAPRMSDGHPVCDGCGNTVADDQFLTHFNTAGRDLFACDSCCEAAEPGSYVARCWAEMKERGLGA